MTDAAFRREQRGVAIGMAVALAVTLAVMAAALLTPHPAPAPSLPDRLRSALHGEIVVAGWLAATIANVARLRFVSEQDIGGSADADASPRLRHASAILQNTLEQAVLAAGAHAAAVATLVHPQPLLVALVSLFSIGRLCFWLGYARGAAARAFGFALTFYPSVVTLLLSAGVLVAG